MKQEYIPDCNFGNIRLAVNTLTSYTEDNCIELNRRVIEVYSKHLLQYRFPMDEEETEVDWQKRVQPILDAEKIRKKGESIEHHRDRLFAPSKGNIHTVAFEIIKIIAEIFQPGTEITELVFKQANWLTVKLFIFDILNLADVPCDDFMPKRPISK